MQTKLRTILLFIAFVSGLLSFTLPILTGYFFFTFDGARDMLWVKNQVDFLKPSLIGPWGSITGIFFGPLWFWILSIPYILGTGDPRIITLFSGLLVFSTGIIAFFFLRKYSYILAYFTLLLGVTSPAILSLSEFAFSQHLLLILTFFLVYSYANILSSYNRKYFLLALLCLSLMFHAEPPTAIFSIPSIILVTLYSSYRKKYLHPINLILGLGVFLLPFLPQLVFELRHEFIQTKALVEYMKGTNTSLGGSLPFAERIPDRITKFLSAFQFAIFKDNFVVATTMLIAVFYINTKLLKDKFAKNLWKGSLIYIFSLFALFLFFKPELKTFYLEGIIFVFILISALVLARLYEIKKLHPIVLVFVLFLIIINTKVYTIPDSLKSHFGERDKISGVYKNNLDIVESIYKDMGGKGFKVYTYDPGIYDYAYQYIFLWLGPKKYDYIPEEFSYLPNVPKYVQFKTEQVKRLSGKTKPADGNVYLIIQKGGEKAIKDAWSHNFPEEKYQLIETKTFPDGTLVEKRKEI